MDEKFAHYIESLHPSFERLTAMKPLKIRELRGPLPSQCVYLFSEGGKSLYVGRTNHFRQRMRQHSTPAAQHNQAVFAFKLAREETGRAVADYSRVGARGAMAKDEVFADAFVRAKARVREMDVRFVAETDPLRQALLEIYVAVALETPHNDFNTH